MRVLPAHDTGQKEDRSGEEATAQPEQIIRKLREADRMLAEGKATAEVAKALEISENTLHRWRNQYCGLKANDVKRLRELERQNSSLKRIVADKELEIDALREVARGNF